MAGIGVLIVDPHQLSREGLKLLLAGDTYEVIGATTALDAALLAIAGGVRPGLLVAVLPAAGEGVQAATQNTALQQIRAVVPDCKIVLLANAISSALLAQATEWRVNALLHGDMSREVLVHSLHLVMLGQAIFPAAAPSCEPANPPDNAAKTPEIAAFRSAALRSIRRMSDREGHVLRLLLSGHSNKMIARDLAISEATVKVHMKAVLRKLNVRNRTQAAMWAAANGFAETSGSPFPAPPAHSRPLAAIAAPRVERVA